MALDMSRFLTRFVDEAREHLQSLEEGLARLESHPGDAQNIAAIFRSAHTIKGSSRMLKLTTISDTAHKLEDLLGVLREGQVSHTAEMGRLMDRCVDTLAVLVDLVAAGQPLPPPDTALCAALSKAATVAPAETAAPGVTESAAAPPVALSPPETAVVADTTPPVSDATTSTPLKSPDSVRVRIAKLDELIKLMGEMVSSQAYLRQRLAESRLLDLQARELAQSHGETVAHSQALHQLYLAFRDDMANQELLMQALKDKALVMRMLPLSMVLDPTARMVRELGRDLGKQVQCVVSGGEVELDRQIIDQLGDPLVHMLRNAIDHGIESPEQRLAAGKSAHGRITLKARQDSGSVVIEVEDDGQGLQVEKIRQKALQKGLLEPHQAESLEPAQILDLIFMPGFSTSAIVTDLSGRGVGMDVVRKTIVEGLHGEINVQASAGKGTKFSIRLPLSLALMRILLCEVAGHPFAFSAQHIHELVRIPQSAILTMAERKVFVLRNMFIPLVGLAQLLNLPAVEGREARALPNSQADVLVVIVRGRQEKLGLIVDQLLDERDMVVKPMPEHMRRLALVSGMVMTGKNRLVSVLQAPALMDLVRSGRGERLVAVERSGAPERHNRHVLVVDDSLNTREIEKEVLEAYGYRVTLADDGLDGLQKARAQRFDAVLTDVEMPRMDGFSLTEQLRQSADYQGVPIIIITSRQKEQDKRRGIQVGASAYIVKGDFDQSNLIEILDNLLD
ncbi:CheA signal transduction histidine kinases [Magnetococcus marinus MC-1]|uniref:Chemotaxis protein CheA n=1 Tax=Magnetococcus marinus (strain ATCC BAA-1437 / JCM 17883 / MC-1) TaxID=156889 RepID=A0L7P8_MAGMM|nr:hybrid sensor histidine kinase/response regulator [Magnetococcus marinus]ABK43991.1 CheA signal transduction histidine kinases [Magnetococcus marinus MC-1]